MPRLRREQEQETTDTRRGNTAGGSYGIEAGLRSAQATQKERIEKMASEKTSRQAGRQALRQAGRHAGNRPPSPPASLLVFQRLDDERAGLEEAVHALGKARALPPRQ